MKWIKHLLLTLLLALGSESFAQKPEMADALRESGKIYIVVIVMSIIFIGVAIYLFTLDRKISKIEKQNNQEQ